MAQKSEFHLSLSASGSEVFAGRTVAMDGREVPSGPRHNVTRDFYSCIIDYAAAQGGFFQIIAADGVWDVTVAKRTYDLEPQGQALEG